MSNRLKMLLLNNWRLKLLAILSAALCFQGIRSATKARKVLEIPVEAALEPGMAVHSQDPMTLTVHFQGAAEDLRWLDQNVLRAVIRPKAGDPDGAEPIMVSPRDIQGHPAAVRVVKIEPPSVHLTFDREIEKFVNVAEPRIDGTPLVGKVQLAYEPRMVRIRGPKRRIEAEAFDVVSTEPVDVSKMGASFTKRVKILYPDDWVTQVEPDEVTVKVTILKESAAREWTNVTVMAMVDPGTSVGPRFDPAAVTLSVQGRAELVETVTRDSAKVFVDCRGLDPSATYELPLNVHLPDAELKAQVAPDTVRVFFSSP